MFFLLNKLNVDTYGSICLSFGWWRCSYGLSFKLILTKHRATDLLRFNLVLSTAFYFNGFYWLFNAVHDQAFNEKPLTNVVLLHSWETECISREPFPKYYNTELFPTQYTLYSPAIRAVLHVMITVLKKKASSFCFPSNALLEHINIYISKGITAKPRTKDQPFIFSQIIMYKYISCTERKTIMKRRKKETF